VHPRAGKLTPESPTDLRTPEDARRMERDAGHRKLAVLPQTRPVRAAAARPVQSVAEFPRSPSLHLPWLPVAHPRLKKAHRAVCPMQKAQPACAQG